MTPIRHAQYSHLPPSEDSHGRQAYLHPFLPTYETSSFLCSGLLSPCQGGSRESDDHRRSHQPQQEVDQQFPSSGSTNYSSLPTTTPAPTKDDDSSNKNDTGESDPSSSASIKWMSSKMRFMKKMMNSDRIDTSKPRRSSQLVLQDQVQQSAGGSISNGNNHNHCLPTGAPVRVCSDCNTTKTPLWRSGPRGPKSLCNACGIRQRKARRAMAAAAVTAGGLNPAVAPAKLPKEKNNTASAPSPSRRGASLLPLRRGSPFMSTNSR